MGEIIAFVVGVVVTGLVLVNNSNAETSRLSSQVRDLQDNQIKISTQLDICKQGYMYK